LPRTGRGMGPATALRPAQEIEKISATAAMLFIYGSFVRCSANGIL
jgi:hypothetical protein